MFKLKAFGWGLLMTAVSIVALFFIVRRTPPNVRALFQA